jgi:hypothetical protein
MKVQKFGFVSIYMLALLAGCGGGGGGGSATTSTTTTISTTSSTAVTFKANSVAAAAYFGDSYEYATSSEHIKNTITTGKENPVRTQYALTSGAWGVNPITHIHQRGYINGSFSTFDGNGNFINFKNTTNTPNSYIFLNADKEIGLVSDITELDISGQSYSSYVTTTALKGLTGTFPTGSKAYRAKLATTADVYIANGLTILSVVPTNSAYFFTSYKSATTPKCIKNSSRALVFTSNITATEYANLNVGTTKGCEADMSSPGITHTFTTRNVGSSIVFESATPDLTLTDFESSIFGIKGSTTVKFVLMIEPTTDTGSYITSESNNAYYFSSGTQTTGSFLANTSYRLNKTAINAIYTSAGKANIP